MATETATVAAAGWLFPVSHFPFGRLRRATCHCPGQMSMSEWKTFHHQRRRAQNEKWGEAGEVRLPGASCCCHPLPKLCLLHCCACITCIPPLPADPSSPVPSAFTIASIDGPAAPSATPSTVTTPAVPSVTFFPPPLLHSQWKYLLKQTWLHLCHNSLSHSILSLSLLPSSSHSLSLDCTGKVWYADASSLPAAQAHKCHLRAPWRTPCGKLQAPRQAAAGSSIVRPTLPRCTHCANCESDNFDSHTQITAAAEISQEATSAATSTALSGQSVSANSVWFNFDSLWSSLPLTRRLSTMPPPLTLSLLFPFPSHSLPPAALLTATSAAIFIKFSLTFRRVRQKVFPHKFAFKQFSLVFLHFGFCFLVKISLAVWATFHRTHSTSTTTSASRPHSGTGRQTDSNLRQLSFWAKSPQKICCL